MRRAPILASVLALALACGGQAFAHARLVTAAPADKAAVAPPARIVLTFNETLQAKFSGFEVRTGGAVAPVKVSLGPDRKSLVGTPERPLAAGVYEVNWRAVTADTHRIEGRLAFTVR